MDFLLPIAAKSFLVAGVVLLLLKLAGNRSASDRSWIAHLGLAAVLLPLVEGDRLVLVPPEGTTERYLLVWLTGLAPDDGRFSAGVTDLAVTG